MFELEPKICTCTSSQTVTSFVTVTMGVWFIKTLTTLSTLTYVVCVQSGFRSKLPYNASYCIYGCPSYDVEKEVRVFVISPPDTGASIKTAPTFSAATAISLDTAGSIVLESMSRDPFFTFLSNKDFRIQDLFGTEYRCNFFKWFEKVSHHNQFS